MKKVYHALYLLCNAFFLSNISLSQDANALFYDQDLLPASFHLKNREELKKLLPEKSVAIFFSNPIQNRANDVNFEYHQDPNFYYFSGFNEPNAVLIISKEPMIIGGVSAYDFLFVPPLDSKEELWNGKRKGVEKAQKTLGFQKVFSTATFANLNINFSNFQSIHALPSIEHCVIDNTEDRTDLASLKKHFYLKTYQLDDSIFTTDFLKDYCAKIREIKKPEELALIRKAINITCEAQLEVMKATIPGNTEYQTEAIIEFIFKNRGAEYPGFPSIVGGGENSCVLHYITNRRMLSFDDMLVNDIGAEYHGYTADITRTIPVNGTFSKEQKILYQIVLKAQKAGIEACLSGNKFWEPHNMAVKVIQEGLMELGIIKEPYEYKNYFMHGSSHYLGLDVHDAGTYSALKKGNIITVEPGIYVAEGSNCDPKWWNIGIRIEDDILITDGKPEVLSDCVVKDVPNIEKTMKQKSLFNKIKK